MPLTRARPGRQRVEDAIALRVADLVRGNLYGSRPDGSAPLRARDGRVVGTVTWRTGLFDGWGRVTVERRRPGEGWAWAIDPVELRPIPHPFGPRWRLVCPRSGRLAAALFLPPGASAFACRQAHALVYRSTRVSPRRRAEARARRARVLLGGSGDLAAPLPVRPKGMWARRYASLAAEAGALSDAVRPL